VVDAAPNLEIQGADQKIGKSRNPLISLDLFLVNGNEPLRLTSFATGLALVHRNEIGCEQLDPLKIALRHFVRTGVKPDSP
jgi:hypothetical protein